MACTAKGEKPTVAGEGWGWGTVTYQGVHHWESKIVHSRAFPQPCTSPSYWWDCTFVSTAHPPMTVWMQLLCYCTFSDLLHNLSHLCIPSLSIAECLPRYVRSCTGTSVLNITYTGCVSVWLLNVYTQ